MPGVDVVYGFVLMILTDSSGEFVWPIKTHSDPAEAKNHILDIMNWNPIQFQKLKFPEFDSYLPIFLSTKDSENELKTTQLWTIESQGR